MPSLTIENYLKSIYTICSRQDQRPAATGQLAEVLSVSPGTVTSMLKTLETSGLVVYTPYEGVKTTETGQQLALRVLRRHRLIELFLVKTLGLSWDEIHEEAENMEHAVSDFLVDRIDEFLGHPQCDPHGDPIPQSDGTIQASQDQSLIDCEPGVLFRLVRVLDQASGFLRHLSDVGLTLGQEGRVVKNLPGIGTISVEVRGQETTLGHDAAAKLRVKQVESQ